SFPLPPWRRHGPPGSCAARTWRWLANSPGKCSRPILLISKTSGIPLCWHPLQRASGLTVRPCCKPCKPTPSRACSRKPCPGPWNAGYLARRSSSSITRDSGALIACLISECGPQPTRHEIHLHSDHGPAGGAGPVGHYSVRIALVAAAGTHRTGALAHLDGRRAGAGQPVHAGAALSCAGTSVALADRPAALCVLRFCPHAGSGGIASHTDQVVSGSPRTQSGAHG